MAAQLPPVLAVGIPQALQAFATVATHLKWNTIGEVHLPLKWEFSQPKDRSYLTRRTVDQVQEIRDFPNRSLGILLLGQFPFRPEHLEEMVDTIYSEIDIILRYTDQVGIVLNIPHDRPQENSGYEALNIALLSADSLTPQLKKRCYFLEPVPEPESVRPFQRLRNRHGHMLEGIQIYYTRQVLSRPEFTEFLRLELPPLTRPHHSLKRPKGELDGPSSSKKARDSRSRHHGSPSHTTTRDPVNSPSSMEVEGRVTFLRLEEAQQKLEVALEKISELQLTVGELRGEMKVLKRLLRKGDTYKDTSSSSSSGSGSSSDSGEDLDDQKGRSGTERKVCIVSSPGSPRPSKREWD